VLDAPYVYRAHYMLGGWDLNMARLRTGESEYLIAMDLFPADPFVPYDLAYEYKNRGLFEPAIAMYRRALRVSPDFRDAWSGVAVCLASEGKFAEAREPAMRALAHGTGDPKVMRTIIEIAAAQVRAAKADVPAEHSGNARGSGKVPGFMQKTSDR
jgi:tetratricopeptide (TPR) repeat protein